MVRSGFWLGYVLLTHDRLHAIIRTAVLITRFYRWLMGEQEKRKLESDIISIFDDMDEVDRESLFVLAWRYALRSILRIRPAAPDNNSSKTSSGKTESKATRSSRERGTRGT